MQVVLDSDPGYRGGPREPELQDRSSGRSIFAAAFVCKKICPFDKHVCKILFICKMVCCFCSVAFCSFLGSDLVSFVHLFVGFDCVFRGPEEVLLQKRVSLF